MVMTADSVHTKGLFRVIHDIKIKVDLTLQPYFASMVGSSFPLSENHVS